jgi:SAM-dependent methyltransferase
VGYQPAPEVVLALIDRLRLDRAVPILALGCTAPWLPAALLAAGYPDITIVYSSIASMEAARTDLGEDAHRMTWVEADVRSLDLGRRYDIWLDAEVLPLTLSAADQEAYLGSLRRTLVPGGHAVFATVTARGHAPYRRLPVRLNELGALKEFLGPDFTAGHARLHEHHTPEGATRQFLYVLAHRKREP